MRLFDKLDDFCSVDFKHESIFLYDEINQRIEIKLKTTSRLTALRYIRLLTIDIENKRYKDRHNKFINFFKEDSIKLNLKPLGKSFCKKCKFIIR